MQCFSVGFLFRSQSFSLRSSPFFSFFPVLVFLSVVFIVCSCLSLRIGEVVAAATTKESSLHSSELYSNFSRVSYSSFYETWNTTGKVTPREYYLSDDPISTSYTGKGVRVVLLDTGLDDLFPLLSLNKVKCKSVVPGVSCGDEGYEHGTRSTSVLAGNLHYSVFPSTEASEKVDVAKKATAKMAQFNSSTTLLKDYPRYRGMAPDAEVLMIRIFDTAHQSRPEYVVKGLDMAEEWGADVINLSFNTEQFWDERILIRIKELIAKEVIVISAAGNGGPEFGTIQHPADLDGVIAVGSSNVLFCSPPSICEISFSLKDDGHHRKPIFLSQSHPLLSPFCPSPSFSVAARESSRLLFPLGHHDGETACEFSVSSRFFSTPQYCCRESVSSFSSRGPTVKELPFGAGRAKPDLVALGEHVLGVPFTLPKISAAPFNFFSMLPLSTNHEGDPVFRKMENEKPSGVRKNVLFSSSQEHLTNITRTMITPTVPFTLWGWEVEEALGTSIASPIVSGVVAQCIEALRQASRENASEEGKGGESEWNETKLHFVLKEEEELRNRDEEAKRQCTFEACTPTSTPKTNFLEGRSSFSHFSQPQLQENTIHPSSAGKSFSSISVTLIKSILVSSATPLSPTKMEQQNEEDMLKRMSQDDAEEARWATSDKETRERTLLECRKDKKFTPNKKNSQSSDHSCESTSQKPFLISSGAQRRTYERYAMALRYSRWSQGAGALNAQKAIHLACAVRKENEKMMMIVKQHGDNENKSDVENNLYAVKGFVPTSENVVLITPPGVLASSPFAFDPAEQENAEETESGSDCRKCLPHPNFFTNTKHWLEWPRNIQPLFPGGPAHIDNVTVCAGKDQIVHASSVAHASRFISSTFSDAENRRSSVNTSDTNEAQNEESADNQNRKAGVYVNDFLKVSCLRWQHRLVKRGEEEVEVEREHVAKNKFCTNRKKIHLDKESIKAVSSSISVTAELNVDSLDGHCGTLSILTTVQKRLSSLLTAREWQVKPENKMEMKNLPNGVPHHERIPICHSYRVMGSLTLVLPSSSFFGIPSLFSRIIPLSYDVLPYPPPRALRFLWDTAHQWMNPVVPSLSSSTSLSPHLYAKGKTDENDDDDEDEAWIPGDDPKLPLTRKPASSENSHLVESKHGPTRDQIGEPAGGDHPHTNGALLLLYLRHELGVYIDFFPLHSWASASDESSTKKVESSTPPSAFSWYNSTSPLPLHWAISRQQQRLKQRLQENSVYLLLDPELPLLSSFRRTLTSAVLNHGLNVVLFADWYNRKLSSHLRFARKKPRTPTAIRRRNHESVEVVAGFKGPFSLSSRSSSRSPCPINHRRDNVGGSCHIPSINRWLQELSTAAGIPAALQLTDAVIDGALLLPQDRNSFFHQVYLPALTPVRLVGHLKGASAVVLHILEKSSEKIVMRAKPESKMNAVQDIFLLEGTQCVNNGSLFPRLSSMLPSILTCSLPGANYYFQSYSAEEVERASTRPEHVKKRSQWIHGDREKERDTSSIIRSKSIIFLTSVKDLAIHLWTQVQERLRRFWRCTGFFLYPKKDYSTGTAAALIHQEEGRTHVWRTFGILEIPRTAPSSFSLTDEGKERKHTRREPQKEGYDTEERRLLSGDTIHHFPPSSLPFSRTSSSASLSTFSTPFPLSPRSLYIPRGTSSVPSFSRVVIFSDSNCLSASDDQVRQLMVRVLFAFEDTDFSDSFFPSHRCDGHSCFYSDAFNPQQRQEEQHHQSSIETEQKTKRKPWYNDFMDKLERDETNRSHSCLELVREMLSTALTGRKEWMCGEVDAGEKIEESDSGALDFHRASVLIGKGSNARDDLGLEGRLFSSWRNPNVCSPSFFIPTIMTAPYNDRVDMIVNQKVAHPSPIALSPLTAHISAQHSTTYKEEEINTTFHSISFFSPHSEGSGIEYEATASKDVNIPLWEAGDNSCLEQQTMHFLHRTAPYRLEVGRRLETLVLQQHEKNELEEPLPSFI